MAVVKKIAVNSVSAPAQSEITFAGAVNDDERSSPILIIGGSGAGKSRSIKNLPPENTFLINVMGKDLPFSGWKRKFTPYVRGGNGNMLVSTSYTIIESTLDTIKNNPKIRYIVIDDFQYLMADEFMRRAMERGFDKFTEIGQHAYNLIRKSATLGQGRIVFFLAHSDVNDEGFEKVKTIGKLLDEKICVEGLFTVVLGCLIDKGQYFFATRNNGKNTVKSPEGMFDSERIENDLYTVAKSVEKYYKEN